ncbi:hypothetical protein [Bdellovibrio reynosensis]|uniref:OmpH family outer membrane protein n=1 Tax=Bdellovibrio reynosensis TaxID=2835041 RepID=A0ABY4C983_9BACT|nr:hypothetical protein [Bdellovibrio reynosensis]UOF00226.1 hypothetical protein MNR06_10990 [Bdellovibrio reynosensis]
MSSAQEKKETPMLLALLLFIGAAGLIFAYLGSEDSKPAKVIETTVKSEKYEKAVNKHLMFTNEKMELERQRMQVENAKLLNSDFNATTPKQAYTNDAKLDLTVENRAAEIANELGRGGQKEEQAMTPDEVVQKELFNQQQSHEYSRAYKEEYARQFIENARRGGYKVILSDDLSRVISVQPLRSRQSMELFGSGQDVQ